MAVHRRAEEVRGRERVRRRRKTRRGIRGANLKAECRRRFKIGRRQGSGRLLARPAAVVRAAGGQGQLLRRRRRNDLWLKDALLFRALLLGYGCIEVIEEHEVCILFRNI